jgi:hypothetical protein
MSGFMVIRPSQHGEDDKVLETDFDTAEEAQAWIDRLPPDEAAYLPFVEAA